MNKVLIVEDNWMTVDVVEEVATLNGFEVVGVATSWDEAHPILESHKPDFAILDINLNGPVDGIEIARRLKMRDIGFVFLTAYKDFNIMQEATELSPIGYLIKPITPETLTATFMLIRQKYKCPTPKPTSNYTIGDDGMIHNPNNELLSLSKAERTVLGLLIKNIGNVVLYNALLNDHETSTEATLRNVMAKLRKKCPDLEIKNIKDTGYIASQKTL